MGSFEPSVPATTADGLTMSDGHVPRQFDQRSMASAPSFKNVSGFRADVGLANMARRTLGIILLLITVFLWTASNFLASYIFADNTFSKPYFVTYINTSCFAISLIPISLRIARAHGFSNVKSSAIEFWQGNVQIYRRLSKGSFKDDSMEASAARLLGDEECDQPAGRSQVLGEGQDMLNVKETAWLSLEFCLLWFLANYLVSACLEYTSVASSTILTSTSSIWTLIFGAMIRVESFSMRKLIGVLASFLGIILISSVDLSGKDNDSNRGNFPHKSQAEIAVGDAMAFGSAIMYGIYTVVMKKRIGNEDRVNMPLFFGLVGLFNVIFLWPGFLVLHYTGVETFELPPTGHIWTIIIVNSISSFVSDYCWAYAMLLTTPLVVTVGISLTIPLSLIGEMILRDQYSGALYWVGAGIVLLSFLFINHESPEDRLQDEQEQLPLEA